MTERYGTVKFYADQFADILIDVDYENIDTMENIIKGFYEAIESLLSYHENQAEAYADAEQVH